MMSKGQMTKIPTTKMKPHNNGFIGKQGTCI